MIYETINILIMLMIIKILTIFSINTKNTFESYLSHTFVVVVFFLLHDIYFVFACERAELNQLTF